MSLQIFVLLSSSRFEKCFTTKELNVGANSKVNLHVRRTSPILLSRAISNVSFGGKKLLATNTKHREALE
jgi:hypothetical protein